MQNPIYQKELFKKRRENMQILPYSEKPVHRESKLFELFESSEMTLDLLVYYLYKRFHQPGVRTYLINKLYEIKNDDLTFYIPELWWVLDFSHKNSRISLSYFVIKRDSLELERFLLDKCSQSIPLYFQVTFFSRNRWFSLENCDFFMIFAQRFIGASLRTEKPTAMIAWNTRN